MAPRRVVLLLLVAAAGLLAWSSSPAVVVHAARDLPPRRDDDVPAAETTTGFQPPTVDALRGVPPHLIHPTVVLADATGDPAVQHTVYDVTVVFRATARLGPPRLQYYVVPISGGADDSTKARAGVGVGVGVACNRNASEAADTAVLLLLPRAPAVDAAVVRTSDGATKARFLSPLRVILLFACAVGGFSTGFFYGRRSARRQAKYQGQV